MAVAIAAMLRPQLAQCEAGRQAALAVPQSRYQVIYADLTIREISAEEAAKLQPAK